jgi:hypothetical protein
MEEMIKKKKEWNRNFSFSLSFLSRMEEEECFFLFNNHPGKKNERKKKKKKR